MRRAAVILAIAAAAASSAGAGDTRLMLDMPDSLSLPASAGGPLVWAIPRESVYGRHFSSGDSTGLSSLSLGFHRAVAPRRYSITTFDHIAEGAGVGGNMALGLGYMGTLFGWWDDDTALKMMAAGMALGAGTQSLLTNEKSRVRWGLSAGP